MDGLSSIAFWVDEVAEVLNLSEPAGYALRLCLEEAAANLVMHAKPTAAAGTDTIEIGLRADADTLRLTVTDQCAAFDPLTQAIPTPPTNLQTARLGGLGIHLMRKFARDVQYSSAVGSNHLVITIARHDRSA